MKNINILYKCTIYIHIYLFIYILISIFLSGTDEDSSHRSVRPRLNIRGGPNNYDASESEHDIEGLPSNDSSQPYASYLPSSSPIRSSSDDSVVNESPSGSLSQSTRRSQSFNSPLDSPNPSQNIKSPMNSSYSSSSSKPPSSSSSSDECNGDTRPSNAPSNAEGDTRPSSADDSEEERQWNDFFYEPYSLSSGSDSDGRASIHDDTAAEDELLDPSYSPPEESSSQGNSGSEQDNNDEENIEPSIEQKRYDVVVKEIKDLQQKKHLSIDAMDRICDAFVLGQLAAKAPMELILPFTSLHNLDARYKIIQEQEAPIGATNKDDKIKSYAMCKKCDHLLEIKQVANCQCGKKHDNLMRHKFKFNGEIDKHFSKTCGSRNAPKAPNQRKCPQAYACINETTGSFNPIVSMHTLNIKSFIKDFAKGEFFESDMTDRFKYQENYGVNGRMPWDAPFWKELEIRIGGAHWLSKANWQNFVCFLTFDGFEKSRGHGGHGGKLCKYI